MHTFPMLFKKGGSGKIQRWEIRVEGNAIITRWGAIGDTLQESAPTVIAEGKNAGRKNATTPEQQAMFEAEAEWKKKQKRGYVLTPEAAQAGEVSDLIAGGVWPMLAEKFRDYAHKVAWPCFGQPKLNGHRLIAILDGLGKCTLWSRTRKPITSVPHIVSALESLGLRNRTLDGEAYNHDLVAKCGLEAVTHIMRQQEPLPEHVLMSYHVYDTVTDDTFVRRNEFLSGEFVDRVLQSVDSHTVAQRYDLKVDGKPVVYIPAQRRIMAVLPVKTVMLTDEDDMQLAFEKFLEQGFEGLMVRNVDGTYLSHATHRSKDLLKVKKADDTEFEVVGVHEGDGKMAGHAVFVCKTDKGVEFDAKMKGPLSRLQYYWQHPEVAIGKQLTVEHYGYTKQGRPWFPVALQLRVDL